MCANKLQTNPEICEALCRLIELCGLPFLKEKASDENTYAPQVIEVLSTLGELVCMESEPVRTEVARAVAEFSTEQSNQALMEGIRVHCYHCTIAGALWSTFPQACMCATAMSYSYISHLHSCVLCVHILASRL